MKSCNYERSQFTFGNEKEKQLPSRINMKSEELSKMFMQSKDVEPNENGNDLEKLSASIKY